MIYIAFTLGLFGSLHCLGMCGPLAFSLVPVNSESKLKSVVNVTSYNLGRVFSYTILGLVAGLFGGVFNFSGIQKPLTILMGVFLIILFLFSMDIEKLLFKSSIYRNLYTSYSKWLSKNLKGVIGSNPFFLGTLNGFIPCGLVYLAMAGALTSGSLVNGALFMLIFGLGTFPTMFVLLTGTSMLKLRGKLRFKRVFAFLQLFVGLFLIYRAFAVDIPLDLSLIQSMTDPIMCH